MHIFFSDSYFVIFRTVNIPFITMARLVLLPVVQRVSVTWNFDPGRYYLA